MIYVKFDKAAVIKMKKTLISTKNKLKKNLTKVNKNLDKIEENWKGLKSKEILSDMEELKQKNEIINKKMDANITLLDSVINTYEQLEKAGVTITTLNIPGLSGSIRGTENMYKTTFNGEEYYIINSPLDPFKYGEYVYKKGLWQRYAQQGQCLMASQIYAVDILNGYMRSFKDFEKPTDSPASKINVSIKNENIEVVKSGIYNFISNGFPAVIKVSQTNGKRHFVTAIGYLGSVSHPSQLNENNILVLDNASGKISTLADSGYGNRKFYKQNNKYEVIGPNDEFLKATTNAYKPTS